MSDPLDQHDELLALIAAVCDGLADDAERRRLDTLLRTDAAARSLYLRYTAMHASLERRRPASALPQPANPDPSPPHPLHTPTLRPPKRLVFALAAALLIASAAAAIYLISVNPKPETRNSQLASPVATVTDAANAVFDSAPLNPGDDVTSQPISVAAGYMELAMHSGVTVNTAGATELRLLGTNRAELTRGTIRAHVPPAARGFTVHAPGFDVVDLGTDFTLSLTPQGRAVLTVTDGRVEVRRTGQPSQVVEAGRAVWIADGVVREADRLADSGDELATQRAAMSAQLDAGDALLAWYRADLGVERDELGKVVRWRSLADRGPDALAMDPVSAPVPLDAVGELAGRPAIRFDGADRLVTNLLPATGDAPRTIIAVVVDRDFDAVAGFHGYRHVAHWGTDEIILHRPRTYGLVTRTVANQTDGVRSIGNHYWGVGLGSDHAPDHDPHILVVAYDGKTDRLWVDGALAGQAAIALDTGDRYGLVIGGIMNRAATEGFLGDIAELLVLDAAIDDGRRQKIEKQLSRRYGIVTEQKQDRTQGDSR